MLQAGPVSQNNDTWRRNNQDAYPLPVMSEPDLGATDGDCARGNGHLYEVISLAESLAQSTGKCFEGESICR